MKKLLLPSVLSLSLLLVSFAKTGHNYVPKDGFILNSETAIKIAEAVWMPIYGEKIYNKKPFIARLNKVGIWVVEGSLAKGMLGGVPYIEIQKSDARILKVSHGK
ncbi:MAG TPA: YbbC/YhhH family protein [Patescibacteria group bacterium]|nr:YbbC/YhhH family protein [Patescibacteria group bacterium]